MNFEYFEYLLNPFTECFKEIQTVRTLAKCRRGGKVLRGDGRYELLTICHETERAIIILKSMTT
jgi:hypothetical protein